MGERGDGPGLKWPAHEGQENNKHSARVAADNSAYYQCEHNGCKITDRDKPWMLPRGKWAGEDQVVQRDGRITGPTNHAKWIGYKITALYSPWVSFSQMAAEFIQAQNSREELEDFLNQRLAEPFEEITGNVEKTLLEAKRDISLPGGVVPDWAQSLLATADTQKDWFAVSVRAWGYGNRSQLIAYGIVSSFDEVLSATIERVFPMANGGQVKPSHLLIDTGGNRTNEVYEFCLRDPGRILATKGASNPMRRPWNVSRLDNGVSLYVFDPNYFKDMLNRLISDPDYGKWLPSSDSTDQYLREMGNEQKVRDRNTGAMRWIPISGGRRLEAWDCEVLQCLGADMANLGAVYEPDKPKVAIQSQRESANPITGYRGKW
jgi:phage terminase large subunit GpA-like protein